MTCSVTNIKIEPVNVTWQIEEQWDVTTVADVASSLNNKYFFIYSGANAKFHVWFNVGGAGVDPAPANSTAIVVAIAANATASAVASAMSAAVLANANFFSSVSSNVVTITAVVAGETNDYVDFNTGFSFSQCQDGLNFDLGYLDGDVEISTEEQLLQVTAHQSGVTPLADLRQGVSAEISLTLKETDLVKLKAIFAGTAGGSHTPTLGTELFGWGTNKQGLNTIIQSRRLVMHPVSKATSDYSEDLCFWKAYAKPETLTYSGENPRVVSVTFSTYLDTSMPEEIQLFSIGDWTQMLPA